MTLEYLEMHGQDSGYNIGIGWYLLEKNKIFFKS